MVTPNPRATPMSTCKVGLPSPRSRLAMVLRGMPERSESCSWLRDSSFLKYFTFEARDAPCVSLLVFGELTMHPPSRCATNSNTVMLVIPTLSINQAQKKHNARRLGFQKSAQGRKHHTNHRCRHTPVQHLTPLSNGSTVRQPRWHLIGRKQSRKRLTFFEESLARLLILPLQSPVPRGSRGSFFIINGRFPCVIYFLFP